MLKNKTLRADNFKRISIKIVLKFHIIYYFLNILLAINCYDSVLTKYSLINHFAISYVLENEIHKLKKIGTS